jgi:multiple sugar transport system permease protein
MGSNRQELSTMSLMIERRRPIQTVRLQRPTSAVRRRSDRIAALVLLAPATIGFALFFALPTAKGIWYSLTDSTLLQSGRFVGLANYRELVSDDRFWNSLRVTLEYVVINVATEMVIGLALAVALDRLTKSSLVRAVILLPWLVPGVTAGIVWRVCCTDR